jgi:site-specific DNA-cytosine methylase
MIWQMADARSGTAVELCAGPGGIGIGLRALGFNLAKAYDSWEEAVAIYNHNFGGEAAATANLLSEKGYQLVKADRRHMGEVELVAAGNMLRPTDRGRQYPERAAATS